MKTVGSRVAVAFVMASTISGSAFAGGLERQGYNIDQLFDAQRFTVETWATFVAPGRDLKNVRDTNPLDGTPSGPTSVRDTANYWVPRVGFKAQIFEDVDCLADYSQPWGVHLNPGQNWAGANSNIETKVTSNNYGLTCSYKTDAGPGDIRFIGGVFYQEVEGFKERLVLASPILPVGAGTGIGRLNLEGNGYGWRAGVAYEIPEYAVRASLVYNSAVKLDDITGSLDLSQVPGVGQNIPVFGSAEMPDSVELKLQSGIAPDWLAFGSVKWTDWSQLQSIAFCPVTTRGTPCTANGPTRRTSLDLLYRDGWNITGGVGHKFNDQWSGAVSLSWDRGTSTGLNTQTDTWTVGTGVSYSPTKQVEWRLAGAVGLLTSGSSGEVAYNGKTYGKDVAYDFDNDVFGAISTSIKVKF